MQVTALQNAHLGCALFCISAGHRRAHAHCTPLIEAIASYPPLIYSLEGRNERPRREASNNGYGLAVVMSNGE